jgi:hypothetical protein
MIWWVSWKGEVRHQPDEPHRRGWSSCIDPKDAPAEFDPAEDEWLQMVLSPTGDLRFVRLAIEDGGWKSLGSCRPMRRCDSPSGGSAPARCADPGSSPAGTMPATALGGAASGPAAGEARSWPDRTGAEPYSPNVVE